jgi:hypothetical protein
MPGGLDVVLRYNTPEWPEPVLTEEQQAIRHALTTAQGIPMTLCLVLAFIRRPGRPPRQGNDEDLGDDADRSQCWRESGAA